MKKTIRRLCFLLLLACTMGLPFGTASAEEWVLADNESIVFTVKEFAEDPFWGPCMKVYLENKTDETLMFAIEDCAVNGVMNDPFWAAQLPAGSKANQDVIWMSFSGNAASAGITQVDFELRVYNSDDWSAPNLWEQAYTIQPLGESGVVPDQYIPDEDDIVLFDNEQAFMAVTGFRNDAVWGYSADVYLQNRSEELLMFSVENATVNGFMCDPFWAAQLPAGLNSYSSISWFKQTFEENAITEVEEIRLGIRVYPAGNWTGNAIVRETFTVNP